MEPERKKGRKGKKKKERRPKLEANDSDDENDTCGGTISTIKLEEGAQKRVGDGAIKEEDASEVARQQACQFEDFAVDYSVWYNVCYLVGDPSRQGVVLIHKATYRPLVVIANLPHESRPDEAIDIEYAIYTDQLDEGQGYIRQWMRRECAALEAPIIMESSAEIYEQLGALTPEQGEDHRVAIMYFLGMAMQQPKPEVAERLMRERRIITVKRRMVRGGGGDEPRVVEIKEEQGGGGEMDVDNK